MSEFKEMKFWIGDDPQLSERIQNILFGMGYGWLSGSTVQYLKSSAFYANQDGSLAFTNDNRKESWFDAQDNEEINIDWMRTAKPETVELGGQTYIKSELEEALSHINPVDFEVGGRK